MYVALGGSEDPNMWDAFLAEVQQCNDCKAGISNLDLQAIFLGPSFSISTKFSKNTMDYVDVGAGMMNSAEVVDVPALLREVKSVLGPRGGAGFLLHFVEEEFAGKIKAFKKALTRQVRRKKSARQQTSSFTNFNTTTPPLSQFQLQPPWNSPTFW